MFGKMSAGSLKAHQEKLLKQYQTLRQKLALTADVNPSSMRVSGQDASTLWKKVQDAKDELIALKHEMLERGMK